MDIKQQFTTLESIIAIQKQLKIAIQNHQVLAAKKHLTKDDKIKGHLDVIQWLILSMGRSQAKLLADFRNEISLKYNLKPNSLAVTNIMKSLLSFPEIPKNIPVYKKSSCFENENKKAVTWKPKLKSVLKVNNKEIVESDKKVSFNKLNGTHLTPIDGSKIKIVINKKKDGNSVLIQQPKKLQSVLKSKNQPHNNIDKAGKTEEGRQSPESNSSNSSNEPKEKDSPTRTSVDDRESSGSPPVSSRMDTRYGKKYEAKISESKKVKAVQPDLNIIIKKEPIDPDYKDYSNSEWSTELPPPRNIVTRTLDENPITKEELDQETFLSLFRLVSIAKCEVLKRKRCERKRRSVAGQSSLYSDYLQPTPKRTYTPRKPVAPVIVPTNNNAVIVESPAADDEEEDKSKATVCFLCHEGEGALEVCFYCSETFHFTCIPMNQKSNCPSCMAQSKISNIVGGNNSIGNASSLELIKRYSNEDNLSDHIAATGTRLSDNSIKDK